MKKFLCLVVLMLFVSFTQNAQAVVLFHEDFNNAPDITALPPFGPGVPVTAGADNDWFAARFSGTGSSASSIAADVGRSSWPLFDFSQNAHGWAKDNAGLLIGLSTSGYTNVQLNFDWYTTLLEQNDSLKVGYFIGDITGFTSRTKDLRDSTGNAAKMSNWTWTNLGLSEFSTTNTTITLPENQSKIWFAFWLNGDDEDFGKVDNINITADVRAVPEPTSLVLLGSGVVGLVSRRRKV